MKNKLRSKVGETLVEAIATVLIVALSAAMLSIMVTTSVKINTEANVAIDALYEELSSAETKTVLVGGTISITSDKPFTIIEDIDIIYFGSGDEALQAYGAVIIP